jgi:hypothetical protein
VGDFLKKIDALAIVGKPLRASDALWVREMHISRTQQCANDGGEDLELAFERELCTDGARLIPEVVERSLIVAGEERVEPGFERGAARGSRLAPRARAGDLKILKQRPGDRRAMGHHARYHGRNADVGRQGPRALVHEE